MKRAKVIGRQAAGILGLLVVCAGIAYIKQGQAWHKIVKPRPAEYDEWTHYLHDSSNNAVSHDTAIGPPRHLQWIGGPKWSRQHDHMSSSSAVVSAGGRNFYIFDEGPDLSIQLPSRWFLIAPRDAFNGKILWKRPIDTWHTRMWALKSGPAHLPRRVVAAGDVVYVTLSLDAPVTALDAATGKTMTALDAETGRTLWTAVCVCCVWTPRPARCWRRGFWTTAILGPARTSKCCSKA